jgi:hypothetical protein
MSLLQKGGRYLFIPLPWVLRQSSSISKTIQIFSRSDVSSNSKSQRFSFPSINFKNTQRRKVVMKSLFMRFINFLKIKPCLPPQPTINPVPWDFPPIKEWPARTPAFKKQTKKSIKEPVPVEEKPKRKKVPTIATWELKKVPKKKTVAKPKAK